MNELTKSEDTHIARYKKLKVEKLGEDALKLVLNSVKAGRSFRSIAEMLTETYSIAVTHKDVSRVLNNNAEIMARVKSDISTEEQNRANMILNESTVLVSDMDKLNKAFDELEQRMQRAIATKDFVEVTKAMSDLAKTRMAMIKNYKKLTGQFKEGPSVLIDQSNKTLNVNAPAEVSSKLAKELAKAQFTNERAPIEQIKPVEDIKPVEETTTVDAEFVEEEKDIVKKF